MLVLRKNKLYLLRENGVYFINFLILNLEDPQVKFN